MPFIQAWARLRVSGLRAGSADRLVNVAGLRAGDSMLDCTCGLGADAIVAAHAVGESGIVVTLESSAMLAAMVSHGMKHYDDGFALLVRAMRRVAVINAEYQGVLPLLSEGSWDVVYFDPMFVSTIDEAKGLDLVRMLGAGGAPSRDVHRRSAARGAAMRRREGPSARAAAARPGYPSGLEDPAGLVRQDGCRVGRSGSTRTSACDRACPSWSSGRCESDPKRPPRAAPIRPLKARSRRVR